MKSWHVFAYVALGVFLALMTPINSMVASLLSPLVGAVTGGKGTYA